MSYAACRAAAANLEELRAERRRAEEREREGEAKFQATLPFLGDDIFVLIAAELTVRALGRLACTAQRFWRKSVADTRTRALKGSAPELWSVVEEGARRHLATMGEQIRGWVSRETSGGSWLRALGDAAKLGMPLRFTEHHDLVQLSEGGA